MKITLFPSFAGEELTATVKGDVITINGEAIDLSGIPEGYMLPGTAVGNPHFVAHIPVERINGELHFALIIKVFEGTDISIRSPEKPNVISVKSGNVKFPDVSVPVEVVPDIPKFVQETQEAPTNG